MKVTVITASSSSSNTDRRPSLHDCLALGEVEVGLPAATAATAASKDKPSTEEEEEVHRLPLLLRLLSSSRPLSSIPNFGIIEREGDGGNADSVADANYNYYDPVIEEAVARLEDRAAMYGAAEGVAMVACHLAPAVTKRISRLRPLKQLQQHPRSHEHPHREHRPSCYSYDLSGLEAIAQNPLLSSFSSSAPSSHKRRRSSVDAGGSSAASDDLRSDMSDGSEMTDAEEMEVADDSRQKQRRRSSNNTSGTVAGEGSSSFAAASEDSQEFIVLKTLQELVQLVVESLKEPTNEGSAHLMIRRMEDSILAEAAILQRASSSSSSSVADLASTVASLLHHAPVLRHEHVANALCRAAVPQAPALIARMGANCPAAVACLLRGCIKVYKMATVDAPRRDSTTKSIAAVAKTAVRRLARLSAREASRALAMLRRDQEDVMVEVQLELAINLDPLTAVCLIIQHLSRGDSVESSVGETSSEAPTESRRKSVEDEEEEDGNSSSQAEKTSLKTLLEESPVLISRVLSFLCDNLAFDNDVVPSWGRVCLFLTGYTWVFYRVSLDELVKSDNGPEKVGRGLDLLHRLVGALKRSMPEQDTVAGSGDIPMETPMDRPFNLLAAALVSTAAVLLTSDGCFVSVGVDRTFASSMQDLVALRLCSRNMEIVSLRIAQAWKFANPKPLRELIVDTLCQCGAKDPEAAVVQNVVLGDRLARVCKWASEKEFPALLVLDGIFEGETALVNPVIAIDLIDSDIAPETLKNSCVKELLSRILSDKSCASVFLRSKSASTFIASATSLLLNVEGPKIPLVLPIQIESVAMSVSMPATLPIGKNIALLLSQMLYCFSFSELEPSSPFKFDPRVLPLGYAYALCCQRPSANRLPVETAECLMLFINRHCPEVKNCYQRCLLLESIEDARLVHSNHVQVEQLKAQLMKVLKRSVAESHNDPSGLMAEKAFNLASRRLATADLFTICASALLSRPRSPPPFFTYPMLYRDPLTMLKLPLSVWARRGTRRIAIVVLTLLLEINDDIISLKAPDDETRAEFLESRNVIVVRCLVNVATASSVNLDGSHGQCAMTCGLIRKMIARYRGLTAALLQQGLTEAQIDWMVESVPEMMEDASALSSVLSTRNSLAAAERLAAADCVLRVAIAHGHRYTEEGDSLVHAALSQLVASFFLIVGPSGVAVNTLVVGEGNGLDATKVSRTAAFRILKALQKVRGYRSRLKNECGLVLQKFAGLCKGEAIVSSLPSAIANCQKALLKELLDAATKALDAMGSGIQL